MTFNTILKLGVASLVVCVSAPSIAQHTTAPDPMMKDMPAKPPAKPMAEKGMPEKDMSAPADQATPAPTPPAQPAVTQAPAPQADYPPCSATVQDQCTNTRREADEKASPGAKTMASHKHRTRRHK